MSHLNPGLLDGSAKVMLIMTRGSSTTMFWLKEKSGAESEEYQRHTPGAQRGGRQAYNSLTDRHLAGYFSNSRIRRHLQRAGLVRQQVDDDGDGDDDDNDDDGDRGGCDTSESYRFEITRSGRIVPDKEYRHKLIQRAHHRHVRECLAQAIFHKVLEMEVDRSKIYEEEIIRILSPRPPTGARGIRKQHSGPEGEHSESSESKILSPSACLEELYQLLWLCVQQVNVKQWDLKSPGSSRPNTAPGKMQRPVRLKPIGSNSTTASLRRSSPYRLLESSNENEQTLNSTMEKESRRHRTTAEPPRGISPYCLPVINNFVTPVPPSTKRRERGVKVTPSGTLRGRRLRPTTASSGVDAYEDPPMLRSSVLQSRVRVNMMYFGKTVHLSHDLTDMRDEVKVFQQHCGGENLCVYKGKLREGETFQFISRRHRGFPFSLTFFLNGLQVERLSSCCEFKHRKGSRLGGRHGHFGFCGVEGASPCYKCIIAMGLDKKPTPPPKRVKDDGVREESVSSLKEAPVMETERTADNESECETSRPQDMETEVKEETAAEDKVRDDYEEDFEADDEGPVEDAEVKVKKSPSPSQETESRALKGDASETEDDEKEEDIKSASGSSSSDSEREESDAEVTKEDEKAENIKEVDPEETAVPLEAATEALPAAPKDSDKQDTAGDSTEIEVCETSVPSANENQQSEEISAEKGVEKMVDESKAEQEQERAKSVQQKLAEAILKESQCSSEPELSDTSTEEEEEKGPEPDSKDAVAVKSITLTEELQAVVEETKCEEEVVSEAEEVQETSDPKEQEEESEQEPQENKDVPKDVKIEEENEKDKNTENVKSEEAEDAATALHPVSQEEMADEDKTSEHQESAKSANEEALEKDNETEEENDVEVDTQLDETGHGAKSSEEDESSVSEPNQIPDETAAPDDAEAMTASETKEMKAEPSEEREALSCEEAPVTHTETRQQGGSEDAETEGTAENSSSSMEGSGDTTVEKRADLSEENAKDESSKDDIKEASAVEESKDGVEEEEDDESKTEERIEKEEIISERTEVDFKDEGNANEEQAEKSQSEEDEVANEEKADELEKTEKDEDGESVKNKNDEEESEEKGDETIESEKVNTAAGGEKDEEESEEKGDETDTAIESEKINTAAGGGKDEEEKDNIDDKSEKDKDEEGSEEKQEESDKTPDRTELPETPDREEKMSEIMEESEKSAGADLDKDNAKISDDNIVESEDVEDSEAENVVQGTETTEETSNNVIESEEVEKETEEVNESSEKGQVDVENGEMSTEKKTQEGEGEVQSDGKNNMKRDENTETKAEEPTEGESTEGKDVTVKSEGDAEKPEVDKAPDVAQTEAKAADDSVEKQEESTQNDDPDTSGMETKDESKSDERNDDEGSKQDENGNVSEPDSENRDSELMKKSDNVSGHVSEVMVASSGDQAQSPTHTAVDLDTAQKLEVSTAQPDSNTEKHTEENHSATDGENGADTEEASKASEEGASVLLQPQTQSPTQNNDNTEESVAEVKETPEVLTRENNAEMVTNWVTKHQTSKFFETCVEPLEDLKESPEPQLNANEEETQSTEQTRAESPLMMAEISQSVNEERDTSKEEPQSSAHSEAGEQSEKDSQQVEETEVKDFLVKPESDQESVKGQDIRSEDQQGSRQSLDKVQEGLMQDDTEQTDVSKTEVESLSGTQHSVTSSRPEGEEKTRPELNEKQANEEQKDLLPLSKTEEQGECSTIPEGLSKLKANETKDTEETLETSEQSREVKEITDFTTSKSDDGSQEETQRKDIDPQPSDGSIDGDRRDVQMIEDIKHTLSKDRLSTFSVDETMFSRSSYPLLTAARTESGH
ncbi:hypothetical protein NQZ68_014888 [Dissostichus eleginoides]|nr:hypothetical protein NQZ68_014888 [Dissostichus eleginoides]